MNTRVVCVQGLGFVGAAMAVAVSNARSQDGKPVYDVIGIDQPTKQGQGRVDSLNGGIFPFSTEDEFLKSALETANRIGNLTATTEEVAYASADVVIVDVPLNIPFLDDEPQLEMSSLKNAIKAIGERVPAGALVMIETTVPPGTCEKIIAPVLQNELIRRGLGSDAVHLAHSFERVMPGHEYLDSIVNIWRVYAGYTTSAADLCEEFLASVIDVERYPLSRLSSTTASEIAKVMENTYRATNIALIDEWTKYAEAVGVDLYEVIDAIRVRPTHCNIRFPGLGVGGYCLTKDPAFAPAAAKQLHGLDDVDFPFSRLAIRVNYDMPLHAAKRLMGLLGGSCSGKKILVLGLSYREDIGDTRNSPTEILVRALEARGAEVSGYDPLIQYWKEMDWVIPDQLPKPDIFDGIVFATPHRVFRSLDILQWLGNARPVVLDTANIVTAEYRRLCREVGIQLESVGRGDGL